MKNYYETLCVTKEASDSDIKKAYHTLSLKYHPDKGGDTQKFQEISEAYEVLSDEQKRKDHDNSFLEHNQSHSYHTSRHPHHPHNMHFAQRFGNDPNNMFNMFFSMNGINITPMHQRNMKPPVLTKVVHITFEEMYRGLTKEVHIEKTNNDTIETEILHLNIPSGIQNNISTLLLNKGNSVNNIRGDLQIIVKVDNKPDYERDGNNIIFKKTISLKEALCGFSFTLLYLNGNEMLIQNKKEGNVIKPNDKIVFQKSGINGGDFIIDLAIQFPDSLTNDQISKLSEIL